MKLKDFYLISCIIGLIIPYSQFIPFAIKHGFDINLFITMLFDNPISSFFAWDVIISAIILTILIIFESLKLGIRKFWLAIAGTFLVGVSFGLPLFLYLRETNFHKHGRR